ncbi:MAG: hypothetical protein LBF33_00340 [Oscillospiraceae bacterium]|jgi:hypothetical protein|nr:hypothetical protein [Oscillospiraceae bacterium]
MIPNNRKENDKKSNKSNLIFSLVSSSMTKVTALEAFVTNDLSHDFLFAIEYVKNNIRYTVEYNLNSKIFFLKNDEDKVISSWLFDENVELDRQAETISKDFLNSMGIFSHSGYDKTRVQKKIVGKKRKNEKSETDPVFLINRLVNIFPDLKIKIFEEKERYGGEIRPVTFTREKIVPVVNKFLSSDLSLEKTKLKKLAQVLDGLYKTGDFDTRSIITVVLLCSIDKKNEDKLKNYIDAELEKSWEAMKKINFANISAEKPKKSFASVIQNTTNKERL